MIDLRALFPGYDHIGSTPYDSLRVELPPGTEAVRVALATPSPEILHLTAVQLLDMQGRRIGLQAEGIDVRTSSAYDDDDVRHGAIALREGRGFHTHREVDPWVQVEWRDRTVAAVEIRNRPDEYGRRSASLAVAARVGRVWQDVYRHDGAPRAMALLARIGLYVSPIELSARLLSGDGAGLRMAILRNILDAVDRDPHHAADLHWVLPLLDVYGGGGATDRDVLSAYFAGVLMRGGRIDQIPVARRILRTRGALLESEGYVNRVLAAAGHEAGMLYTRHGLQRSLLRSRARDYLELATSVIATLEAAGVEAFISYGSLLGAVRERDFIAHDDDMDIVYVGHANDPTDLGERQRVLDCLAAAGFCLVPQWPLLNVHVSGDVPGVSVDLFPSWRAEDLLHLYMERMVIRPVPADTVLPLSAVDLLGHRFPAPACPETFLGDRYGDRWGTSDRFFEWPYPLEPDDRASG